jgi:hypothetical protein
MIIVASILLIISAAGWAAFANRQRKVNALQAELDDALLTVRRCTKREGRTRGVAERANRRADKLERSVLEMDAEVARLTDEASRSLPAAPWRTADPRIPAKPWPPGQVLTVPGPADLTLLDEKAETYATTGPRS